MNNTSSITIKDVAQQAGVSVGTVSRVLNGYHNIKPGNASRVRQVVEKLGYRKCNVASNLASTRHGFRNMTGNIGVLLPRMTVQWLDHPLISVYMGGIEQACTEHGFHPMIEFLSVDEMAEVPRFIKENKVDGYLIKGAEPTTGHLRELMRDLPIVGMNMHEPGLCIPQVMSDDRAAGWQVAAYLWGQGHRRIGFVASDDHHRMFIHRQQGVEEFLRLHNAEDKALITRSKHMGQYSGVVPELTPPDMHDVLDAFWSLPTDRRPTAIIVANDWSAIGMYEALSARGIDVPGQVSVIGFDNVVSVCCSLKPALTTYDIPIRLAAYTAAKLLLQLIDSPNRFISPGIQMISGQLILRDSVRRVVPDEQ